MISLSIKDIHIGNRLYCRNSIGNYTKGKVYTVMDTSFFQLFHKIKGENCLPIDYYFIRLPKKEELESNPKSMTKEEIEDELGYKIKIVSKQ
ncbi:hypothetical protein [Clostridioides difficile]|uniref:hypothetical protein n=1 Tax=Clostridioides difficile TaxID=1496 RepID=UPI001C15C8E5|nr:hypothetical protein [Clostridioides difficile]MCP8368609.1 hypothetical protein [Clostridioides difficile]HBF7929089.1 hypothetical protein [Clostridioides difficile]